MADFGGVLFSEQPEALLPGKGLKGWLAERREEKRRKTLDYGQYLSKIPLCDNVTFYRVDLPYTAVRLQEKGAGELGRVEKLVGDLGGGAFNHYLMAEADYRVCPLQGCISNPYSGKLLYRSLALHILEDVCKNWGTNPADLDIAVIQGSSDDVDEVYHIVEQLSGKVRFLTVAAADRAILQQRLEEIGEETGLSVRISEDLRRSLASADFVVNFGSSEIFPHHIKINPKSMILHYGAGDPPGAFSGNPQICGVEISFPGSYYAKLDKGIYRFAQKLQLAEMILCHQLELQEQLLTNPSVCLAPLSLQFKKEGFLIKNLMGRRNPLRIEDLRRYS